MADDQHIYKCLYTRCQCRTKSYGFMGSMKDRSLSLEILKKKTEAKFFFKRLTSSHSRRDQTPRVLPPRIDPSDPPPRGNKRAFLCAVSYKNQRYELQGTLQDLTNMTSLLMDRFGFPPESILILAENESYMSPTRKNIEEGFRWLMREIKPNHSLVFFFSGHGKRQRDEVRDEIDGFDETICPVDFEDNGQIIDNYINEAIVRPLIKGVTLHAIIDCCHSGTVLDLPHVYNAVIDRWEDNSPPSGADKRPRGGKAICFSACEDYQLAADTSALSKEIAGAMTFAFIRAIKDPVDKNNKITYRSILQSIHDTLKHAHRLENSGCFIAGIQRLFNHRILQDPLLSSSEKFDINEEFKL